uniref:Troponin T, cardiac muscle isoforms n=1 Tax=Phallusia mammillata TaxID=59560 RepID=A0A6F9DVF1_9ASCI|nr:troponin T, cardiac muscle isoforms [Phallusia mammillata]
MVVETTQKSTENKIENVFKKLVQNYKETSAQLETGDNEEFEYCLISMPSDFPISTLNDLSVNLGSSETYIQSQGNKSNYILNYNTELSNQKVILADSPSHSTMIVKDTTHSLNIRQTIDETTPDLGNCIPKAIPPPVPDNVQIRFKPFGWQSPTDLQHHKQQSTIEPRTKQKKHKRKLGKKFDPEDDKNGNLDLSNMNSLKKQKKKHKLDKEKTIKVERDVNGTFSLPQGNDMKPAKKKKKKHKKEK